MSQKVLLLLLGIFLQSCSIFSGSSSVSLQLPEHIKLLKQEVFLEELGTDPIFYRVNTTQTSNISAPLFMAFLRECSAQKNNLPGTAASRQLLIGLEALSIQELRHLKLGDANYAVSRASGKLDEKQIDLASFSTRRSDCLYDLVFWSAHPYDFGFISENEEQSQLASKLEELIDQDS